MTRAVIALGANLGDRASTLRAAAAAIASLDGVRVVASSHEVESVALTLDGRSTDKPTYRNGVVIAETSMPPHRLLDALHAIEDRHGRVRAERWGDRTLDLDIVALSDPDAAVLVDDAVLTVPHPRAHERDFVLAPWLDADPDATLPGRGSDAALLATVGDSTTRIAGPRLADDLPEDPA